MQLHLNESDPRVLYENDGFDKRLISNEPAAIRKLKWQYETEVICAITNYSVS